MLVWNNIIKKKSIKINVKIVWEIKLLYHIFLEKHKQYITQISRLKVLNIDSQLESEVYNLASILSDKVNIYCNYMELPAGNYMFKVNNRNTRTRCEICSKLIIKIPERLLLTLNVFYILF